jgi:hypothetical protein
VITWKIESLTVKPQQGSHTDVVVTAAWRCVGESGDIYLSNYGTASFAAPGSTFTPYDQLTEAQVLSWCYANGVDKAGVEANVRLELNERINPPVVSKPLPWVVG